MPPPEPDAGAARASAPARRGRLAARLGLSTFLLVVLAALTLAVANGSWSVEVTLQLVAFASFAVVGAILLDQRAHPIGWICLAIGFGGAINGIAQEYGRFAAAHPGTPGASFVGPLGLLIGFPLTAMAFTFLPLLFPDGRLPSPRWWPVAWLAVVDIVVLLVAVGFTSPGLFGGEPSPLAIIPAGPASEAIGTLAAILTLGAGVLCAGSLLVRYRRVDSDERQQLKWVAGAMAVFALSLVVSVLLPPIDTFAWVLPIVPISVGIAILRYRLYDIDILIGRALAYVALSALLAGGYAASVALFQRLFILVTGDRSDAAIVITTLILASIFTPARKALEGVVERRFRPPEAVAAPAPEAVLVALDDPQLERRIDAIARAAVRDALRDRS